MKSEITLPLSQKYLIMSHHQRLFLKIIAIADDEVISVIKKQEIFYFCVTDSRDCDRLNKIATNML